MRWAWLILLPSLSFAGTHIMQNDPINLNYTTGLLDISTQTNLSVATFAGNGATPIYLNGDTLTLSKTIHLAGSSGAPGTISSMTFVSASDPSGAITIAPAFISGGGGVINVSTHGAVVSGSGGLTMVGPFTANLITASSSSISELWASTFTVTNPPNQTAKFYSDGYGDVLNIYQLQYAGNYGAYILYQQGNSIIWKVGSDMYDSYCADGVSVCQRQPFIIKDKSLSPVFSFDQAHRMAIGKTWTPSVNYLNVSGNTSIGNWVDSDTAPINGLMVTGNTIIGSTNTHALSALSQLESYGATTNSYSLYVSTSLNTYHLSVSTMGHINSKGPTPTVGACGIGPSVVGSDNAGTISVGTGVTTSCTLTFASAWNSVPACVLSANSTATTGDVASVSTTAVTFGFSVSIGSGQVYYHCIGRE